MRRLLYSPSMILLFTCGLTAAEPRAHWERVGIKGGSELLTLFAVLPGDELGSSEEIPLLSVLRDTLGDDNPDNDRLRYVWLLADQDRGRLRRWFTPEPGPKDVPRPVVDLAAPAKGIWKGVLRRLLQTMMIDARGAALRVPSRSYLSSEAASQTVRLFEAVTVMARLEADATPGPLRGDEYTQVLTRVLLAERVFGGIVRDASLDRILRREMRARRQALGRNWELLRQRAEAEGLYFQPLAHAGAPAPAAIVWVSRGDVLKGRTRPFRSRFLGIADPWGGALREWSGYSETWHFDSEGRRAAGASDAARSEEMIPLAMYSLDHPKAPFLLIDFRSPWKPAAREVARRTVEEIPMTILGVATFTNWEVRGAQVAWNSVRGRQGAAIYRPARLRAAASARQVVPTTPELQPELRERIQKQLGAIAPSSPVRYQALTAAAQSSDRLARRVERDRGRELAKLLHPTRTRLLNAASVATLGIYRYRVRPTPERLDLLDRERRVSYAIRVIERALKASPRVEMCGDLDRVRRAAHDLVAIQSIRRATSERTVRLLTRLAEQSGDEHVRQEFLALLHNLEKPGSGVSTGGGED